MPHLTRTVNECLRLGLVVRSSEHSAPGITRIRIVTALVHLRAGVNRPACDRSDALRYRTLTDPALVDCLTCLQY